MRISRRPARHLSVALTVTLIALSGVAYAAGGGPEGMGYEIGTHIYSSGPLIEGHAFGLAMKINPSTMRVLHADMMHHTTMAHPQKIPCMMSPIPKHRGMVSLLCMPSS